MKWPAVLSIPAAAVILVAAGCDDDRCTKICKRVAMCKEDAQKSPERVLGEKAPPPNKRCLERCRSDSEEFANCEAVRRTCDKLRDCLGADFED